MGARRLLDLGLAAAAGRRAVGGRPAFDRQYVAPKKCKLVYSRDICSPPCVVERSDYQAFYEISVF
jgi:hypothetical protein